MKNTTIFYQLFEPESSTYTYLIADGDSMEAALIDSVLETFERDLTLINELGLQLKYLLETHVHADHITGAGQIRKRTGAKIGIAKTSGTSCADVLLENGQTLFLGKKEIRVMATPGHTNTCMSFYFEGRVFTGDALLIRGNGRTDFQKGSANTLYESITQKLFQLPEETQVYPGHDYKGQTASTIKMEKDFNPRIGKGRAKEEFVQIMKDLKLANPKKMDIAVPANLKCGIVD